MILFGYTWAFIHHMFGGLRHLGWDTGLGFEFRSVNMTARFSVFGSIGMTGLIWMAPHLVQLGMRQ